MVVVLSPCSTLCPSWTQLRRALPWMAIPVVLECTTAILLVSSPNHMVPNASDLTSVSYVTFHPLLWIHWHARLILSILLALRETPCRFQVTTVTTSSSLTCPLFLAFLLLSLLVLRPTYLSPCGLSLLLLFPLRVWGPGLGWIVCIFIRARCDLCLALTPEKKHPACVLVGPKGGPRLGVVLGVPGGGWVPGPPLVSRRLRISFFRWRSLPFLGPRCSILPHNSWCALPLAPREGKNTLSKQPPNKFLCPSSPSPENYPAEQLLPQSFSKTLSLLRSSYC